MNLVASACRARSLILLAPEGGYPTNFRVCADTKVYEHAVAEMQRFRGSVYVSEGYLHPRDLSHDGRHVQPADNRSWHLLTLDAYGAVGACGRLLIHQPHARFSDLLISHSALAHSDNWGYLLRQAAEGEIRSARQRRMHFAELGGWAVGRELRCTTEAVRLVLAGYALAQTLGGVLGLSAVNTEHYSSSILSRIGGMSLATDGNQFPSFYEPQYHAEVRLLRFDSSRPNPRFEASILQCRAAMATATVIASEPRGAVPDAGIGSEILARQQSMELNSGH
jgi:hypothetical protein